MYPAPNMGSTFFFFFEKSQFLLVRTDVSRSQSGYQGFSLLLSCYFKCLFKNIYFMYLFLAGLSLHCFIQAFSSCRKQGLPSWCGTLASRCSDSSCCRAQVLGRSAFSSCDVWAQWLQLPGSRDGLRSWGAQAQELGFTGSVAPRHVGSFQTREQTHVSCIGRQILYRWATREAPFPVPLSGQLVHIDTFNSKQRVTRLKFKLFFVLQLYLLFSMPTILNDKGDIGI